MPACKVWKNIASLLSQQLFGPKITLMQAYFFEVQASRHNVLVTFLNIWQNYDVNYN